MKNLKAKQASLLNEITSMYNSRNVYQLKDIQPWSESLNGVQVCVIERSNNSALAHYSCKNIEENFRSPCDSDVLKLFSTRTQPFPCCDWFGISSWMCGADCWPVSQSGTENISASDSSSESPRFFVAGKEPSRLKILNFAAAAEQFLHLLIKNWFLTLSYGLRRQCCPFSWGLLKML